MQTFSPQDFFVLGSPDICLHMWTDIALKFLRNWQLYPAFRFLLDDKDDMTQNTNIHKKF